jgi:hypothetical protein
VRYAAIQPKGLLMNIVEQVWRDASELWAVEQSIAELEEELKQLKRRRAMLRAGIPKLLAELGTVTLSSGELTITLGWQARGSFPRVMRDGPEAVEQAIETLRAQGGVDLVKTEIKLEFPQQRWSEADVVYSELRQRWPDVYRDYAVHSSTLRSWVVRQFEAGNVFDPTPLGVEVLPVANVKGRKSTRVLAAVTDHQMEDYDVD